MRTALFSLLAFALVGTSVRAGDYACAKTPCAKDCFPCAKKNTVSFGFGYLNARAREIVYGGPGGEDGNELSHLIWDVENALTFNFGLRREINCRLSAFANGTISLGPDDSHMVDFDWLRPTTDWSDRSNHPDTNLNHYVQIDAGIDYKAIQRDRFDVIMRLGFRYTDISLDAYGGTFIYTNANFRDNRGTFPDGELGISYRQSLPGFYMAPRVEYDLNCKTRLKVGGLAGFTFAATDRDHHWLTGTLFEGDLESRGFYGFNVGIDYCVKPNTILFLEGTYDKYIRTEGETTNIQQGVAVNNGPNSEGAELATSQVKAGVKVKF